MEEFPQGVDESDDRVVHEDHGYGSTHPRALFSPHRVEAAEPRSPTSYGLLFPCREPSPPYELGCDWNGSVEMSPLPASCMCEGCQPTGVWPRWCSSFSFWAECENVWCLEHDAALNWAYCDGCRPTCVWPRMCPAIHGHKGASTPYEFALHHEWSAVPVRGGPTSQPESDTSEPFSPGWGKFVSQ